MKNPFFFDQHPLSQFLLLALLVVLGFFMFFFIGIISSLVFSPLSFSDLLGGLDFNDPEMVPVMKNLQIWQSLGIFVAPSLIIAWLAARSPWQFLGLDRKMILQPFLMVIVIMIVSIPAINQLIIWNEQMKLPGFLSGIEQWMSDKEELAAGLTEVFLVTGSFWGLMVNILMVAVIPAFGEELFFRGILQKLMGRWFKNMHLAVILASVLFSAMHFQFYGFLPRFLLGLIFGYLFAWSGNLWYPILAHLVNNIIPVLAYYFLGAEAVEKPFEQMGEGSLSLVWFAAGLILTALAVYQFKKSIFPENKSP